MKHELEMCCGTTCDKNLNAEYVAKLERERDELATHVVQYERGALDAVQLLPGGDIRVELRDVYDASPATSLAEVKAQAVEQFAATVQRDSIHNPTLMAIAKNYAERIRQGAK